MAFHFNWSPLIADTDRVRHMLTSSLNKTPKPPIIVDDIIVNELNLGSTPPSLEILEVGDLAEDRFRGVFRVKYEGDAYLTLRTKVQANPLNTFLSTKSEWVNPGVGAAGGGLTIPLQITLSDIRMSGFVILVFSKQKGITLVFRNDPLESLKVSSTFDSIPFVREYLQRTIEGQLRVLFMEDLPAIIHRLSLRVFNAEAAAAGTEVREGNQEVERRLEQNFEREAKAQQQEEDVMEVFGYEPRGEVYADFSQKNLLRLAAMAESQRTLSLFTPGIRDTVYRAWASSEQHGQDGMATPGFHHHRPTLSRIQSQLNMAHGGASVGPGSAATLSSAASFTSEGGASLATRPSMASAPTTYSFSSSAAGGHGRSGRPRKRKNRVVNLRKDRNKEAATEGAGGEDGVSVSSGYETASRSGSLHLSAGEASSGVMMGKEGAASTVPTSTAPSLQPGETKREGEVFTPHGSPKKKVGWREQQSQSEHGEMQSGEDRNATIRERRRQRPVTPRNPTFDAGAFADPDETPRQSMYLPPQTTEQQSERPKREKLPRMQTLPTHPPSHPPEQKSAPLPRTASDLSISEMVSGFPNPAQQHPGEGGGEGSNGGILEQAWMMKMAAEIAKRVAEEKAKGRPLPTWRPGDEGFEGQVGGEHEAPPPAYVS